MNSVGVLLLKVPKETSEGLAGKKETQNHVKNRCQKDFFCSRDLKEISKKY